MPTLASTVAPESFFAITSLNRDVVRRALNKLPTAETDVSLEDSSISNVRFLLGSQTDPRTQPPREIRTRLIDNSTALELIPEIIDREAEALEMAARDSFASDEDDTRFRIQMELFVRRYHGEAVESFAALIFPSPSDPVAASRMLEVIGAIDDRLTVTERFWLLQQGLRSTHAVMRYGAALGFASLQDRGSLAILEEAVRCESNEELRNVLLQVCAFLEASH